MDIGRTFNRKFGKKGDEDKEVKKRGSKSDGYPFTVDNSYQKLQSSNGVVATAPLEQGVLTVEPKRRGIKTKSYRHEESSENSDTNDSFKPVANDSYNVESDSTKEVSEYLNTLDNAVESVTGVDEAITSEQQTDEGVADSSEEDYFEGTTDTDDTNTSVEDSSVADSEGDTVVGSDTEDSSVGDSNIEDSVSDDTSEDNANNGEQGVQDDEDDICISYDNTDDLHGDEMTLKEIFCNESVQDKITFLADVFGQIDELLAYLQEDLSKADSRVEEVNQSIDKIVNEIAFCDDTEGLTKVNQIKGLLKQRNDIETLRNVTTAVIDKYSGEKVADNEGQE